MDDTEKYMLSAIEQSVVAKAGGGWPFGSVVVSGGEIAGRGYDTSRTSHDVTAHAEINAIRNACEKLGRNNLEDCTIYCTNEPCNMCASAIFQAGIKSIYIGATRDELPQLLRPRKIRISDLAKDLNYVPTITTGILKNRVLELFKDVNPAS